MVALAENPHAEAGLELDFTIQGMSCAACAARIEKALGRMDGVTEVAVSFPLRTAWVQVKEGAVSKEQLAEKVGTLGFTAKLNETAQTGLRRERAWLLTRLIASLLLTLPLLGAISLAITLESHGPILFRQRRVGRGGRLFTLFKFRSMRDGAEDLHQDMLAHSETTGPIFKMRRDPRVTQVGRLIRRLSLDELPQLWNVIRGDMSLVGPRPPMPAEVDEYAEWHRKRLDVSPGMTGLWQVSGRQELAYDDRVRLDLHYIENWSLWLDLAIIARTIPAVLSMRGAY